MDTGKADPLYKLHLELNLIEVFRQKVKKPAFPVVSV